MYFANLNLKTEKIPDQEHGSTGHQLEIYTDDLLQVHLILLQNPHGYIRDIKKKKKLFRDNINRVT